MLGHRRHRLTALQQQQQQQLGLTQVPHRLRQARLFFRPQRRRSHQLTSSSSKASEKPETSMTSSLPEMRLFLTRTEISSNLDRGRDSETRFTGNRATDLKDRFWTATSTPTPTSTPTWSSTKRSQCDGDDKRVTRCYDDL